MASECNNKETSDIVETETADSDEKTKTVIAFLNLFHSIMLFPPSGTFLVSSLLITKPGMTRFADNAILKHMSSHFISFSQILIILRKSLHIPYSVSQKTVQNNVFVRTSSNFNQF